MPYWSTLMGNITFLILTVLFHPLDLSFFLSDNDWSQ
jgi:hypothetical protein